MNFEYYSYTSGDGEAFIYFITTLTLFEEPKEGSKVYFGTMLKRIAGSQTNYDVGMCEITYEKEKPEAKPRVNDLWITEKLF